MPTVVRPVENPELALAQPLVDDGPRGGRPTARPLADDLGGLARPHIRRGQDEFGPLVGRQSGEPAARGFGLLVAEFGQGHVDVAQVDVDLMRARLVGGVARDIALALAMADEPQSLGPVLAHRRFLSASNISVQLFNAWCIVAQR